jgi:SAM-dependent methyltransferase
MLGQLWRTPPRDIARKVSKRLRGSTQPDVRDLVRSPRYMRAQMPYDFFSRYEVIAQRACGWQPLDFADRDVLEVGCGPVLGFGPLAVFLGCRRFCAVDPVIRKETLYHPDLIETYFLRVYKDLAGVYGPRVSYEDFLRGLRERVTLSTTGITECAEPDQAFDIALSNSTLEHLHPLSDSIRSLRRLTRPTARQMHLVDFGNHRATRNPFSGIYNVTPEQYFAKHGNGINLARPPDLLRLFAEHGFDVALATYYRFDEFYDEPIDEYWRSAYSTADLFLKTAVLVSR